MATIDWSAELRTKDGKICVLQDRIPHETRRRVLMCRDGSDPRKGQMNKPGRETTVWLYPEDGIARCDRQPSDDDLINA